MDDRKYVFTGGFEHDTFTHNMDLVSSEFDEATGQLKPAHAYTDSYNYGFICRNHAGTCLYGVETRLDKGSIVTYKIEEGGKAVLESETALEGAVFGIHCTVSKDDRFLIAAFASSSTVYSCGLNADGTLQGVADVFKLPQGTPTTPRQMSGPAPHQAQFDRSGRYMFIPDIHSDRLYCMAFDNETGKMVQTDCAFVDGGQGPRHVVVHKNNKWVYLLTEIGTSLYFFEFDEKTGKLTQKQSLALVPRSYIDANSDREILSAEIVLSMDGRFVLASMRGYFDDDGCDRIFSAEIDESSGEIKVVKSFSSGGMCPRMIDFSPNGEYLLVGNQFSDELLAFRYDSSAGSLKEICGRAPAPASASLCCF